MKYLNLTVPRGCRSADDPHRAAFAGGEQGPEGVGNQEGLSFALRWGAYAAAPAPNQSQEPVKLIIVAFRERYLLSSATIHGGPKNRACPSVLPGDQEQIMNIIIHCA
jgi:hypothetical protein